MILQNTHGMLGMLGMLCKIINGEFRTSWKTLEDMVAKVCVSTQQIYTVLVEIKTSLAGPDIRWTFFQAPFLVEDTFGQKFPVPSEYDFDLLDAVVKHKFSSGPGSAEVHDGNYEYFKTKDSNASISGKSRLFPGMAITMAVIVPRPGSVSDTCPVSGCSSLSLTEMPSGGKTCSECNVWFSPTNKKLKSLHDLVLASSMVSNVSAVGHQSGNGANPRKRAASPLAEEDEPKFKNIRLSSVETAVESFPDDSLFFEDGYTNLINAGLVDYSRAHGYVNKIKTCQPGKYRQFLEILQTYQQDALPIANVYSQVQHLFTEFPDLLEGFNHFLPKDVSTQPNIESPPMLDKKVVSNISRMLEFDDALKLVDKIKERYSHQLETFHEFQQILETYQRDELSIRTVYTRVQHLLTESPDLLEEFERFIPNHVSTQSNNWCETETEGSNSLVTNSTIGISSLLTSVCPLWNHK